MDITTLNAVVAGVAAIIGAIGGALGGYAAWAKYIEERQKKRREEAEQKLDQERKESLPPPVPVLGKIIWNRTPESAPDLPYERRKRVISVGNFKGGVGKTTLSANLAAYLATKEGAKVLLIDFDYQGSLSNTCARMIGARRNSYTSAKLLAPSPSFRELKELALPLTNEIKPSHSLQNVDMFTAFYPLDIQETQQLIDWSKGGVSDVRYRLRDVLNSPEFAEYDTVIIDCPPRFSTATINALCASTHLIIPTILDLLSSEAVTYFAEQLQTLRPTVFPHLKLLGIVPTMVYNGPDNLTLREDKVAERINAEVRRILGADSWVMKDAAVPDLASIANVAGEGISYVVNARTQEVWNLIGQKVSRRLT